MLGNPDSMVRCAENKMRGDAIVVGDNSRMTGSCSEVGINDILADFDFNKIGLGRRQAKGGHMMLVGQISCERLCRLVLTLSGESNALVSKLGQMFYGNANALVVIADHGRKSAVDVLAPGVDDHEGNGTVHEHLAVFFGGHV